MGLPVRRDRCFPDDRNLVVLSGERAACALRLSVSLHDHRSDRAARRQAGDTGRGKGDPDLSFRRHRDGDLQDAGRLLDLSGAEFLPDRRRAAVLRLHVRLHWQLYLPRVAAVRFRVFRIIRGASAWPCSASRSTSTSSAITTWSTCVGSCSPGPAGCSYAPASISGFGTTIVRCRYCSGSDWCRSSSGSRKTSARSPGSGSIRPSGTAGRWFPSTSSARGSCC